MQFSIVKPGYQFRISLFPQPSTSNSNMSLPRVNTPPESGGSYIIPQLEGERISVPGSNSVFRIYASQSQTNGAMAVFAYDAVKGDTPGFHHHEKAHDIFLVSDGYMRLWNHDRCLILGPGDFASVPPVTS